MSPVDLPELPEAEITGIEFSPDESRIAFYASTARSPRDLYVSDLGGGEVHQVSHSLNAEIDPENLVEPEIVRFASYDGVEVPGLLYKPHRASADHKVPGADLDPRRPRRPVAGRLQRGHPVPGQPRLRGLRDQQPGLERIRQDVLPHGRPQARRGRSGRRGRVEEDAARHRLGRGGQDRRPGRQLRRLPDPRRGDVPAGGVRRRRRSVRHLQLGADAGEHSALVGGLPRRPLQGDGRPGRGRRAAAPHLAAVPCGPDPPAADGAPGRQRSARAQGRVRRDRRGGAGQRRAGGVRGVRRRGPWVRQQGQSPGGLREDPRSSSTPTSRAKGRLRRSGRPGEGDGDGAPAEEKAA